MYIEFMLVLNQDMSNEGVKDVWRTATRLFVLTQRKFIL